MKRLSARQYGIALVDLLEASAVSRRPAVVRGFLTFLQKRHQLRWLPAIVAAAERERLRRTDTVPVTAVSARPLPATASQTLRAALHKDVQLNATVDPALGAGVRLTIGETRIDSSLPTMLRQLRDQLVRA